MSKLDKFSNITKEMYELYERKNKDYGDSFGKTFKEYGLVMAAIRIEDKLQRFKKLIKSEAEVKDESIRDTLIDLANYSAMTIIELDKMIDSKK
ncbi:nucleotide modification associated domain-containing protein [Anaerophilus nitritogenes]|uniref:nucleotide modification associated domain-containing protein n=1 Tax=Anaerophilus nitritogenes TaxID=2498136 RepID=UPI00101D1A71|nr:nucleotide modification associated domain-containing protein [Anaerophilus nitritogenes]